ncbi:MAG: T9SS type A sorting domain-containing protein [bacterium]|nr:T9SS type A sorting domain-containing protein [bacterium]
MNWPSPGNDPWYAANPTESLWRRNYYAVNATPTHLIDGASAGGSLTSVTSAYNARRAIDAPVWLKLRGAPSPNGDSIYCYIKAVANTASATNTRLRVVIVENEEFWTTPAPNGQTHFPFPFVKFGNDTAGFTFNHSGIVTDTMTFIARFPLRTTGQQPYTLDNCGFVAFVQAPNREILQSSYKNFNSIIFPKGNERVFITDSARLRWDAAGFGDSVTIELNTSYPTGPWTELVASTANTGSWLWTVTGPETNSARIRVHSAGNMDDADMSLGNFTIASSAQVIISPNPITATIPADGSLDQMITVTNNSAFTYSAILEPDMGVENYEYNSGDADWVDATGGQIGPSGDDVVVGPYPLWFPFSFYGQTYQNVYMCTNGFISFGTFAAGNSYSNTNYPTNVAATMLAPFWDDLNVSGMGTTYVLLDSTMAVFSWENVPLYGVASSSMTFQVVLYQDGRIVYNYLNMTGTTNGSTVGMQQSTSNYLTVSYNQTLLANIGHYFTMTHRWGIPSLMTFDVAAGGSQQFTLHYAGAGRSNQVLNGGIRFAGNTIPFSVPVTLTVEQSGMNETPSIPLAFEVGEAYPNPFNPSTTIRYTVRNASPISMLLYDVNGRLVQTVLQEYRDAGVYHQTIRGDVLASGTYFLKVEAGSSFSAIRKIVLMK